MSPRVNQAESKTSIARLTGIFKQSLFVYNYKESQPSNTPYEPTNTSDIICAYINKITLKLCYRMSRDRFTIEYPLTDVQENARLVRVGMTKGLRLQFKMSLI